MQSRLLCGCTGLALGRDNEKYGVWVGVGRNLFNLIKKTHCLIYLWEINPPPPS
jgi:hypothetical protein